MRSQDTPIEVLKFSGGGRHVAQPRRLQSNESPSGIKPEPVLSWEQPGSGSAFGPMGSPASFTSERGMTWQGAGPSEASPNPPLLHPQLPTQQMVSAWHVPAPARRSGDGEPARGGRACRARDPQLKGRHARPTQALERSPLSPGTRQQHVEEMYVSGYPLHTDQFYAAEQDM